VKIVFPRTAQTVVIASILTLFSCGASMARDNEGGGSCGKPTDGAGCYNCTSNSCSTQFPGKDMGDPGYRKCIETGMNACDASYPKRVNPINRKDFLNNLIKSGNGQMQTKP
jgi:hypothetical protein